MIHYWDGAESRLQKWRGCPNHNGTWNEEGDACMRLGNRFAASIVSASKSPTCSGREWCDASGGVVFRPEFNRLLCSYGADMATVRFMDGCPRPFCPRSMGMINGICWNQPHAPKDLDNMLRWWYNYGTDYNEVEVDMAYYDAGLPHSVAAIINDRAVHAQFLRTYNVDASDYPLVGFAHGNINAPFYRMQ